MSDMIEGYREFVHSVQLEEYNELTDVVEDNTYTVGDRVVVKDGDSTSKVMTIKTIFYDHGYVKITTIDEQNNEEEFDNNMMEGSDFINLTVIG